jgi:Protein of unknown function (DUF1573)
MKKIISGLLAIILFIGCKETDKKNDSKTTSSTEAGISNATDPDSTPEIDKENLTTIEWLETQEKDLGKIAEGQKLEVSFRFKNTGTKPLVISRVWAQCGCTIPETPQEPFAPGQEGVIKASFDSQGRSGMNTKEVYVNANTDPVTNRLVFKVEVNKKPA